MVKIRKPEKREFREVISLIKELAEFEKLAPPDKEAESKLYRDSFGRHPKFWILVAETGNKIVGYVFYFFTYSSFLARPTLYLEDIYVSKRWRNKGIGKMFFEQLLQIAEKKGCGRMEWAVLDWNKDAIRFYERIGARELKEWKYYRYEIKNQEFR